MPYNSSEVLFERFGERISIIIIEISSMITSSSSIIPSQQYLAYSAVIRAMLEVSG